MTELNSQTLVALLQEVLQRAAFYEQRREDYHLIVIADSGEVRLLSFSSLDALVAQLREFHGTDNQCVPFVGAPLPITKGPNRYLVSPTGERVPLFVHTAPDEFDTTWHMGTPPAPLPPAPDPHQNLDAADDSASGEQLDDDDLSEEELEEWDETESEELEEL